jgi:photosystem II stability/assembly factor-like uncharacterized protein
MKTVWCIVLLFSVLTAPVHARTNETETPAYLLHCAVLFSVPDQASPLGYAHPARSVGLFRREHKDTWINMHHPNLFSYGLSYFRRGDTFRLYIAGGNGLHRSSDGGETWKVLTGWRTEDVLSVVPHTRDSTIVYLSTPFGVFKTADDGETWERKMNGMERWYVQRIIADHRSPDILYAAAEDDAYVSRDAGENWVALGVGPEEILELVQHPTKSEILLAGTENHGIYVSINGGESWSAGIHFPATAAYAIAFAPEGRTAYAGGYRTGLWRSTDNGLTWEILRSPGEIEAIYAVTVHPEDPDYIVIGTNGKGLYESYDGGNSWNHAGLYGAHVQQIKFIPRYE